MILSSPRTVVMSCVLFAAVYLFGETPKKPSTERKPVVRRIDRLALCQNLCRTFDWCPLCKERRDISQLPQDAVYIVPSKEDIVRLLKFYTKRREFNSYIRDGWDCDDFSREFTHWSRVWSRYHYGDKPAAVAVATAWVKLDGNLSDLFPGNNSYFVGYHALNLILCDDGRWFFFEPQTVAMVSIEAALLEGTITILRIEI